MAGSTEKEDMIQQQVIRAAQQLYQQHGLHKVTMEDVAKAIGKGKSSLYYYYKSKEEIFDAVMNVEIKEIIAEIAHAVNMADTIEEKIQAFCIAKFKISKKRKTTFNTMDTGMNIDELASYTRTKQHLHKQFRMQESAFFKKILEAGIEKREILSIDENEMDMVVFVLLSSFRGLKREIIEENNDKDEDEAARTMCTLIMNGLRRQ